jgi:capsular polysaccharide biosynthesis protein
MASIILYRLRDGSWGIRSQVFLRNGAQVIVSSPSGKWRRETVNKVLWTDGRTWLASIKPNADKPCHLTEAKSD